MQLAGLISDACYWCHSRSRMHNKVSVAEFFWHLLPVAVLRLAALMKETLACMHKTQCKPAQRWS